MAKDHQSNIIVKYTISFSDTAVSINTAVQQAGDGEVEAYLALTDSITEIIKYIPRSVLSEPNLTDKQTHLEEV